MIEDRSGRPGLHARDVLHEERLRPKFKHESNEFVNQRVHRIEHITRAHVTETLTRGPTSDQIDLAIDSQQRTDLFTGKIRYGRADGQSVREIALMSRDVVPVTIDGDHDVKSGLLKPQREAAGA